MPRVHVAILARHHDVQPVARGGAEFGEHRRGHEADLRALARARALGLPGGVARERRAREVGVRCLVEHEFSGGVPGVDVPLHVVGHDLFAPIAEQVARGGSLEHGAVVGTRHLAARERVLARMQRQRVGVHRPARQV